MKPCEKPVEFEKLIAWWLDGLEDEALDEHLLGCGYCAQRAEELAAYAQGIRAAVRNGAIDLALTPGFLSHLKKQGLRIREYPVDPGGSVNCTIKAGDDAVLSRLRVPLAGTTRVDALRSVEIGGSIERDRVEDLPFDPVTGEVLILHSSTELRKMPAHIARVQLVAVDESGERKLGDYTFEHAPG